MGWLGNALEGVSNALSGALGEGGVVSNAMSNLSTASEVVDTARNTYETITGGAAPARTGGALGFRNNGSAGGLSLSSNVMSPRMTTLATTSNSVSRNDSNEGGGLLAGGLTVGTLILAFIAYLFFKK